MYILSLRSIPEDSFGFIYPGGWDLFVNAIEVNGFFGNFLYLFCFIWILIWTLNFFYCQVFSLKSHGKFFLVNRTFLSYPNWSKKLSLLVLSLSMESRGGEDCVFVCAVMNIYVYWYKTDLFCQWVLVVKQSQMQQITPNHWTLHSSWHTYTQHITLCQGSAAGRET